MTRENKFKKSKSRESHVKTKAPSQTRSTQTAGKSAKRTISQVSQPEPDPTITSRPRLSASTSKHGNSNHAAGANAPPQKIPSPVPKDATVTVPTPLSLPVDIHSLETSHNVLSLNVISSSKIRQKVLQIVKHLNDAESPKPPLIVIHAKAHVASKLISIVEIAKRQFNKQKVYQYSGVSSIVEELKKKEPKKEGPQLEEGHPADAGNAAGPEPDKDGDVDEDDGEDDAFEDMRDPKVQVGADNERKTMRAIPVLTIYLSLRPVPILKQALGTNDLIMQASASFDTQQPFTCLTRDVSWVHYVGLAGASNLDMQTFGQALRASGLCCVRLSWLAALYSIGNVQVRLGSGCGFKSDEAIETSCLCLFCVDIASGWSRFKLRGDRSVLFRARWSKKDLKAV